MRWQKEMQLQADCRGRGDKAYHGKRRVKPAIRKEIDMNRAHDALTRQMLEWIAQGTHSYAEVLDVWKSSCPRLTIWEDACADGLVNSAPGMQGVVSLTDKGKGFLCGRNV